MSRSLLLIGLVLLLAWPVDQVLAIEVVDAVITTAIIDRQPVDKVEAFPIRNGKLYCFTRITGVDEPTVVYHVWFLDKQLMSRVELPVNSSDWRTWSAKTFLAEWPGEWRVEIQDIDGNLLKEVNFQLRG